MTIQQDKQVMYKKSEENPTKKFPRSLKVEVGDNIVVSRIGYKLMKGVS